MANELASCPFCGGECFVGKDEDGWWVARCTNQNCEAQIAGGGEQARAVALWNNRADPLQGAADWIVSALTPVTAGDLQSRLLIGYNRASRLYMAAQSSAAIRSRTPSKETGADLSGAERKI